MKNLFILMLVVVAQVASAELPRPAFDCSQSAEVDRLLNLIKADQFLGRVYQNTTARLSEKLTVTYRYCTSDTVAAKFVVGFQKAGFDEFSRFEVTTSVDVLSGTAKVRSVAVSSPDYLAQDGLIPHEFTDPTRVTDNNAAYAVLNPFRQDANFGALIQDLEAFQRIGTFVAATASTKTDKHVLGGYSWTDIVTRYTNPNEANFELTLVVRTRVQPYGGNKAYEVSLENAYSGPYYGGQH